MTAYELEANGMLALDNIESGETNIGIPELDCSFLNQDLKDQSLNFKWGSLFKYYNTPTTKTGRVHARAAS